MSAPARRRKVRYGRWALMGSALFHAGLVVLADRYLRDKPTAVEAPAMAVELVQLAPREPPSDKAPRAQPPSVRVRAAPSAVAPAYSVRVTPADPSALAGAVVGGRLDPGARRALRSLTGCAGDLAHLSPAERDRCLERLAGLRLEGPGPKLNLDPQGRFAENPEAYLTRRPKDRCKPMATGDVDRFGETNHLKSGILCAFSF